MRRTRVLVVALALAAPWVVAAPAGADGHIPPDCFVLPEIADLTQFNVIIGTNGDDRLKGTDGPDFICGLLGDDRIDARGGDDIVLGDTTTFFGNVQAPGGDDRIDAGKGNDQVLSGPGDDRVDGGSGDDFIALAVGRDRADGGPGDDTINGGFDRDRIEGGKGDDTLVGGSGDDRIEGGSGDDTLFGELPPGSTPPPGVPLPPASDKDRCDGGGGFDVAGDCDRVDDVEQRL